MAAGSSDPQAGDIEDTLQLIFPKEFETAETSKFRSSYASGTSKATE